MNKNVNIFKIDDNSLQNARNYVLHNQLVAFPTETVYGLGANALSDEAIRQVYLAKGRPLDNPIIVHLPKEADVSKYVYDDKPYVKKIREAFLPGPLTLVYKSKGVVSSLVSCGLDTLAIRVPSSEEAQKFLSYVGVPIAAPSANISKHTSPVTAEHVFGDFGFNIPMILDGGRCQGGIESTVLDVTTDMPIILRKGLITAEMIKAVVGRCEYAASTSELSKRSPGTKYRHYCPNTSTMLFDLGQIDKLKDTYNELKQSGKNPLIMCVNDIAETLQGYNVYNLGKTGEQMAARLYFGLHEAERYDILIGVKFEIKDEVMLSVENRFLKAFG